MTKAKFRPEGSEADIDVACKKLQKAENKEALMDFIREAVTMQSLK